MDRSKKTRYYRTEHAGHKSIFHFHYIISFVCSPDMSKHGKNKQYRGISLVHLLHGWAIPQENTMVYQCGANKHNCKSASIFQIMRN